MIVFVNNQIKFIYPLRETLAPTYPMLLFFKKKWKMIRHCVCERVFTENNHDKILVLIDFIILSLFDLWSKTDV